MCEVERDQRPDFGWYCKKTGKPVIHVTPLGMYCEDKCDFDATAEIMDKVTETFGNDPQALIAQLMEPGGFEKTVRHIAKSLDTEDMRELYKRQKELDPNLDKKVQEFDADIEEIFRHGNKPR